MSDEWILYDNFSICDKNLKPELNIDAFSSYEIRKKIFTKKEIATHTNCASWAFFLPLNPKTKKCWGNEGYIPGSISNTRIDKTQNKKNYVNSIITALKNDMNNFYHIEKIDEEPFKINKKKSMKDFYYVGFYFTKYKNLFTFHFIRSELDGYWSQKPGIGAGVAQDITKIKFTDKISTQTWDNQNLFFTLSVILKITKKQ